MRRQSLTSIIILVCLILVAAIMVNGQSTRRFIVDVPFGFTVVGRTLPAGKYVVERIDPTKPNVVLLKNSDSGIVRLLITQRAEKNETSTDSCLIFKRRGEKYHLFQVWVLGYKDGNQLPPADEKERGDQLSNSPVLVRVRAHNKGP